MNIYTYTYRIMLFLSSLLAGCVCNPVDSQVGLRVAAAKGGRRSTTCNGRPSDLKAVANKENKNKVERNSKRRNEVN